ncbi:TNT domain-containing protein [Nocardiopsis sp. CNT312]|uniref:TNT domain-containing protein n=1 Tax=Nocardiopsis sp. CNT312 TaxID=1137268 RepID=UPI0004906552|nr:TNT domain-containing protein [Nocardiopsis sp. CNT312]
MPRTTPLVGTALALALAAAPAHATASVEQPPTASALDGCPARYEPPTADELERYLCGDPRLGPASLPSEGPVAALVEGYERFGGLTPAAFLDRWYLEDQVDPATGDTFDGWDYPEHNGFAVQDGEPVSGLRVLGSGELLDRFGSPRGTFLAPAGAPYAERALPPDSLNTYPGGTEHNYHCYAVLEDLTALVGPITPHFGQPGGGEQLLVPAEGVPEADGDGFVRVVRLLELGYLGEQPAEACVDGADDRAVPA